MKCEICSTDKVRVRFGNQSHCMDCYNTVMATKLGTELPELSKTFAANDTNGVKRIFEVERQITGTAILLTVRERWEQGYEFEVDGELDVDQHNLFKQPKEKTTRGLSETYPEKGKFPSGKSFTYVKQHHLKGVLAYDSVDYVLNQLRLYFGELFPQVFKTITSDNGSKLSNLTKGLQGVTNVYFAHPYAPYESGSNGRHNGLLRRYIPKGKAISDYSTASIQRIYQTLNHLPRKIFIYRQPAVLFEEE